MTKLAFEDLECIHLLVFSINIHWFEFSGVGTFNLHSDGGTLIREFIKVCNVPPPRIKVCNVPPSRIKKKQ